MAQHLCHLARLIDDILDVSWTRAGKLELKKDKVAVKAIIDDAVKLSRPYIEGSSHKLDVLLPSPLLYIEADFVHMAQVISKLFNNAANTCRKAVVSAC